MKISKIISLTIILILSISGCLSPEEQIGNKFNWEKLETVKIGVVLPLTGNNSNYGNGLKDGIEFARDELNKSYGAGGKKIELIFINSQSKSENCPLAIERLYKKGVIGIILGYNSADAECSKYTVEKLRIPTVLPMATRDALTDNSKFLIRCCFNERQQAKTLASYAWYYRKLLRMGILVDVDDSSRYSLSIAQSTAQEFNDLGGFVTDVVDFEGQKSKEDYRYMAKSMLASNPQAILISADAINSGRMIKVLREEGFQGLLLGPDSWDEHELLEHCGEKPGDTSFLGFFSTEYDSPESQRFCKSYEDKYGILPISDNAQGYDSLKILAAILDRPTNIYEFEANIAKLNNYPGAAGTYRYFGSDRTPDRTIFFKVIKSSKTSKTKTRFLLKRSFSPLLLEQFDN